MENIENNPQSETQLAQKVQMFGQRKHAFQKNSFKRANMVFNL